MTQTNQPKLITCAMDADYDFAHESELLQEAAEAADRRDYEAYGNAHMAHDYFSDFDAA